MRHHVLPQSWGGEEGTNLVRICGTCHDNVHDLLNWYVRRGGEPTWLIRMHYSKAVRGWAAKAWAQRPSDKPPYTTVTTVGR